MFTPKYFTPREWFVDGVTYTPLGWVTCPTPLFWNALCKLHCPSSGADSVGHPLSAKELLALKDYILPEDVIESLQQEGLDLNTIGFVQTTIEDVQRRLDSLGQSELASSLRQRLDFGKHLKLVNFITSHIYNEQEKL